ncbi:MAG: transglycosylase domain-containing protein [Clostridia bacterium]|nr:transglycosylase domain-containing protein [Clostridia bacterium]
MIYITQFINPEIGIDLNNLSLAYTSTIYYTDNATGEPVVEEKLYLNENCIWVDLENIPDNLVNAFIAIEDQRFWEHNGVDWKRTFGAIINTFTGTDSRYGGSTIDQQLIKNLTGDNEVSIKRKIMEIVRALHLEKKYSKETILEVYLNRINLGSTYTGVQVAANSYFNKDVSELTLAECASIAAITQAPTKYNPQLNPENNRIRAIVVLDQMLAQGYISPQQHADAKEELDNLVIQPRRNIDQPEFIQSYFTDQVIEEVVKDLMEQYGYEKNHAMNIVYTGGLNIYCTMDKDIQNIMEQKYAETEFNNATNKYGENIESAMVVMDYSGAVRGIIGGREKTGNRVLNRATQSLRPPGSSIKPLSVYGPAFEYSKDIVWNLEIEDSPVDGKWPKNQSGTPSGEMVTVQRGLALSLNTIAVRVMKEFVTTSVSYEFLKTKLHISSLVESEKVNGKTLSDISLAPLALGQLTNGISVLELCAGYTIFGSGGMHADPYFYEKVTDSTGNLILEKKPNVTEALSESTAFIMNKLLQTVVNSGTGTPAKFKGFEIGGKTGTSNDDCDRWFVGYTPYYVAAAWTGFDSPTTVKGFRTNPSVTIWKKVMQAIHEGLPAKSFPKAPSGVYASGGGWYKKGTKPYEPPEPEPDPEESSPGEPGEDSSSSEEESMSGEVVVESSSSGGEAESSSPSSTEHSSSGGG